jgi:hypothetical protein
LPLDDGQVNSLLATVAIVSIENGVDVPTVTGVLGNSQTGLSPLGLLGPEVCVQANVTEPEYPATAVSVTFETAVPPGET